MPSTHSSLAPHDEDALSVAPRTYKQRRAARRLSKLITGGVKATPDSTSLRLILVNLLMLQRDRAGREGGAAQLVQLRPRGPGPPNPNWPLPMRAMEKADDAQRVLAETVKAFPHGTIAKLALVDFVKQQPAWPGHKAKKTLRGHISRRSENNDLPPEFSGRCSSGQARA